MSPETRPAREVFGSYDVGERMIRPRIGQKFSPPYALTLPYKPMALLAIGNGS